MSEILITGKQVRMARAGLKWSGAELAKKSGVALSTIKRMETDESYPSARVQNIQAIKQTFEQTGRVLFEGENGVFVAPDEKE